MAFSGLLTAILFASPAGDGDSGAHPPTGIRFTETIPTHERAPLERSFVEALPLACNAIPCTKDCTADEATVGLEVGGDRRDYTLHWVATDPRLDSPLVLDSSCRLCGRVELESQLAAELGRLCARLDALDAAAGELELRATPRHARLWIDGRAVGRTPWSGELPAGEHIIDLRARRHLPLRREIEVYPNVRERMHLRLIPAEASRGVRPFWPGWTSLGLGIAMSVAGTALIAVHGQPYAGRCTGDDVDVDGNCRYVFTTRPLGLSLAAIGVGAIASGIGLIVWAQKAPDQTYAGLSLGGRF